MRANAGQLQTAIVIISSDGPGLRIPPIALLIGLILQQLYCEQTTYLRYELNMYQLIRQSIIWYLFIIN